MTTPSNVPWHTKLRHLLTQPTYSDEIDEHRRRIQMVVRLTLLHLLLIFMAGAQIFFTTQTVPLPAVVQFTLNATILLLIHLRWFNVGIGLTVATAVISNLALLPFSDLTSLMYTVTAFVAVSMVLDRRLRLPYAFLMIGLILLAGLFTADNPVYASVTHTNVVLFAVLGIVSVLISTSVVDGDLQQIRSQVRELSESAQRYRLMAENINDMITLHAPDGRFIYVTPSYVNAIGYCADELLRMSVSELDALVYPEDRPLVRGTAARKVMGGEGLATLEYRRQRKDGTYFWVESNSTPIFDAAGQVAQIIISARDITRRRQMETALRESEQHANALLNAIPDLVFHLARDGRVIDFKGDEADLLIPRERLIGRRLQDTSTPPELIEQWLYYLEQALEQQRIQIHEYQLEVPLRGLQYFEARTIASGTDEVLVIIRNVTERKASEQRQIQLMAELESANQELQDFAHIISHDLKAPLRGMNMVANWLATDYGTLLDEQGQQMLDLLSNRVQRMEAMINGVLKYSRLGQRAPATEVDLQALVSDIIQDIVANAPCSIIIKQPLPTIWAAPVHMQQVFQNLLDNASKYADKAECQIQIAYEQQDDHWLFSVSDNGPGIEERHFQKIFQIFQTLNPRDEIESTGIGLTIVKRIIETHGGTIWLQSTVGVGSTFFFTVPVNPKL